MELFKKEIDDGEVKARCYYTEEKISVTFTGSKSRKQFFWGEGERYDDELDAIKAADAFVKGITH